VLLSGGAVIALVWSDFHQLRPGRYLFKPLAAAAFIWLALAVDATGSGYGRWLLGGLLCCMAGDLLLMAENQRCFLAGLVAFLCGHLLYAGAFLHLPSSVSGLAITSLPVLVLLVGSSRWLLPHLDGNMKLPVLAYIVVISAMLLCAGLAAGQPGAVLIIGGAWGFAISDLSVARQQFVHANRVNKTWGTPLYFLSQMLLAGSAALA
jgi:uncharacterized membrane protein YhhN